MDETTREIPGLSNGTNEEVAQNSGIFIPQSLGLSKRKPAESSRIRQIFMMSIPITITA